MPTQWFLPTSVTQFAEVIQHVAWSGEENGFDNIKNIEYCFICTKTPLLHIANNTTNDLKMKTCYLFLTGFNINNLPNEISGIEAEFNMLRGGRITDETIQLRYNDIFIGDNLATGTLENIKIFGGYNNLWGLETPIDPTMLVSPNFGIGVRFQSHPSWPHRESPMINHIRLRVW
jgi:hypothetical protein